MDYWITLELAIKKNRNNISVRPSHYIACFSGKRLQFYKIITKTTRNTPEQPGFEQTQWKENWEACIITVISGVDIFSQNKIYLQKYVSAVIKCAIHIMDKGQYCIYVHGMGCTTQRNGDMNGDLSWMRVEFGCTGVFLQNVF